MIFLTEAGAQCYSKLFEKLSGSSKSKGGKGAKSGWGKGGWTDADRKKAAAARKRKNPPHVSAHYWAGRAKEYAGWAKGGSGHDAERDHHRAARAHLLASRFFKRAKLSGLADHHYAEYTKHKALAPSIIRRPEIVTKRMSKSELRSAVSKLDRTHPVRNMKPEHQELYLAAVERYKKDPKALVKDLGPDKVGAGALLQSWVNGPHEPLSFHLQDSIARLGLSDAPARKDDGRKSKNYPIDFDKKTGIASWRGRNSPSDSDHGSPVHKKFKPVVSGPPIQVSVNVDRSVLLMYAATQAALSKDQKTFKPADKPLGYVHLFRGIHGEYGEQLYGAKVGTEQKVYNINSWTLMHKSAEHFATEVPLGEYMKYGNRNERRDMVVTQYKPHQSHVLFSYDHLDKTGAYNYKKSGYSSEDEQVVLGRRMRVKKHWGHNKNVAQVEMETVE